MPSTGLAGEERRMEYQPSRQILTPAGETLTPQWRIVRQVVTTISKCESKAKTRIGTEEIKAQR